MSVPDALNVLTSRPPDWIVATPNVNDSANEYCGRCASPLSGEAVGKLLEVEARASKLAALLKKPEVVEFLARELAKTTA